MTTNYPSAVKQARMAAVITAAGTTAVLEIGSSGMAAVLATVALGNPIGTASGPVLTLSGFPRADTSADAGGKALSARIRTAGGGTDVVTGWDVGLNATAAPARAASTAVTLGAYRSNGTEIYKCVTAGTTSSGGGPSGTGTAITDGTVTWDWYCKANAEVQMDSLEFTFGQNVSISSAAITHAA